MKKPISTKAHGILDYMTAGLLVTLPRALGWSNCVTRLLDASAASTVVYSVMTRYELGLVKALPMKAHLTMDAVGGGALIGAAAFLEDEDPEVRATLAALGVWELGAALMTETQSPQDRARVDRRMEQQRGEAITSSMPQAPVAAGVGQGNTREGIRHETSPDQVAAVRELLPNRPM